MEHPLQISFRGVTSTEAIEAKVQERAARLERYHDQIMSCRVMIESPHRHQHQGKLYHVRIDLTVPGAELVVSREPPAHHEHEDVYVAIRDAFDAAQRRLEDHARVRRGAVKVHADRPVARVCKLFPDGGYGFVETPDGREIYFHRNSVLDGAFDELAVGSRIEFAEAMGEQGPCASTVRLVDKGGPRV